MGLRATNAADSALSNAGYVDMWITDNATFKQVHGILVDRSAYFVFIRAILGFQTTRNTLYEVSNYLSKKLLLFINEHDIFV